LQAAWLRQRWIPVLEDPYRRANGSVLELDHRVNLLIDLQLAATILVVK
jgi:hypothetical protein